MTSTVLVTGATGFLGQHLVRTLSQHGCPIRVLARPESDTGVIAACGVEISRGNILDAASLRPALKGVGLVFHLAGRLHMPGITEEMYQQLHVDGTRNLLTACLEIEPLPKIVHCSTTGVTGPTGPKPAAEHTPPVSGPSTAYEHSKAAAEQLARAIAQQHGLPLVVARPSLVYGPGDLHLLGWFRAIQKGYYRVVGAGDNFLHPIYIDDLVEGLLRCGGAPAVVGRIYNIVGPKPISIKEIAAAIARALGRPLSPWHLPVSWAYAIASLLEALPGLPPAALPLTRSRIAFMIESRAYCGKLAQTELGFTPQVELETGLKQTVTWYRSEGLL